MPAARYGVVVVLLLAACTSVPAPPGKSAVRLSCAYAGSGTHTPSSDDVSAVGLTLEGLARPVADVPRTSDLGFRMPDGASEQHLRKSPADVTAGAGPVTVELVDPTGGQALMWVPADQWSSSLDPRRWTTTKVIFDGCPDRDVTYFGGLLAPAADSCLHLRVRPAGSAGLDRRLRLDGRPC